jgi:hypothetical protein
MKPIRQRLRKDHEEVLLKFKDLVEKADRILQEIVSSHDGRSVPGELLTELRVSSINLLERLASGGDNVYVAELRAMPSDGFNVRSFKGVLLAARTDYQQGFMVDHDLLISGEVFADLLVQAEVLLENDYKDAAAVLIRAVLEDGLRRLCAHHKIDTERRATLQQLNEQLYKKRVYSALQHKEIIAKAEIGNCAAHGRFNEYTKEDVAAFLEFVRRYLAEAMW